MKPKVLISQLWNVPSRLGDKLGWDWLTYNPGVFLEFALVARRNSPIFAKSIAKVFPNAEKICDVGAGTGQFVQALRKLGKSAEGFEYSSWGRAFARITGCGLGNFDLNAEPCLSETASYDLTFSLEVGEHIPDFLAPRFVKTLVDSAPIVVLTCAQPGQPGHGHINCQKKDYWINLFAHESYVLSDAEQEMLLEEFGKYPRLSPFIVSNLMVFRKQST